MIRQATTKTCVAKVILLKPAAYRKTWNAASSALPIFFRFWRKPDRTGSMDLQDILDDLQHRVSLGELDTKVVEKLAERAEVYYRLAHGEM